MTEADQPQKINIELDSELYIALEAKANQVGKTTTELIEQSLSQLLKPEADLLQSDRESEIQARFVGLKVQLETQLENQLELYVKGFVKGWVENFLEQRLQQESLPQIKLDLASQASAIAAIQAQIQTQIQTQKSAIATEPQVSAPNVLVPTIRQLQVGDLVQVRDPDSPHYMEKVRLTKVSLIRATIQTETGEHILLKRDLRYVQSSDHSV
jgi:hypothetical protein